MNREALMEWVAGNFNCDKREDALACVKDAIWAAHELTNDRDAKRIAELEGELAEARRSTPPEVASMDAVEGDKLPPIGSKVAIHLARHDAWIEHTVTGYYAWPDLSGCDEVHRVFVRVVDGCGYENARLLKDIRTSTEAERG